MKEKVFDWEGFFKKVREGEKFLLRNIDPKRNYYLVYAVGFYAGWHAKHWWAVLTSLAIYWILKKIIYRGSKITKNYGGN